MPFKDSHVRYGIVKDHVKCRCLAVMFSQVNKVAYLIKRYEYAIVRLFQGPCISQLTTLNIHALNFFPPATPRTCCGLLRANNSCSLSEEGYLYRQLTGRINPVMREPIWTELIRVVKLQTTFFSNNGKALCLFTQQQRTFFSPQ